MIFENSSPKGIFGPNMSDSPNWSLTANSLSLHAATLNCVCLIMPRPHENVCKTFLLTIKIDK